MKDSTPPDTERALVERHQDEIDGKHTMNENKAITPLPAIASLPSLQSGIKPFGATHTPLAPSSVSSPGGAQLGGALWHSLMAPIRKFWEVPPIHVSTYYGAANQPGRPGPVLSIIIERAAVLRSRAKQRIKRQQQQQKLLAAAAAASSLSSLASISNNEIMPSSNTPVAAPSRHSSNAMQADLLPSGGNSNSNNNASGSLSAIASPSTPATSPSADNNSNLVDIEGVLLITPRAIERYHLNGALIRKAGLPDTITAFYSAKIAGVGRVYICGTQNGRVHLLKTDLTDTMLVFDTQCLNVALVNASKKTVAQVLRRPTITPTSRSYGSYKTSSSSLSFASDGNELQPSIFANPPRLIAEAVFLAASFSASSVELEKKRRPEHDSDPKGIVLSEDMLHRLGTITGDGITPALLEARSSEIKRLLSRKSNVTMDKIPEFLKLPSGSDIHHHPIELFENQHALTKLLEDAIEAGILPPKYQEVLNTLLESMEAPVEICSLGTLCAFSNFCEAILAGTSRGEIFCWEVPSGRLLLALEYPGDLFFPSKNELPLNKKNCSSLNSSRFVAAMQTINLSDGAYRLWAGYGSGHLAIFDPKQSGDPLHCLEIPDPREPVTSIEVASQLAVVLVLSGNSRITAWTCTESPKLLTTFTTTTLTQSIPLTCFKVIETPRRGHNAATAVLFLGCVDGSLIIHRLLWAQAFGSHALPLQRHRYCSNLSGAGGFVDDFSAAPVNTVETEANWKIDGEDFASPILECLLVKSFPREVEPVCPLSALWVDPYLDTVFVGDASGVVATLLPIRHLLHGGNGVTFPSSPFLTSQQRRVQSRLHSIEYRCFPETSTKKNTSTTQPPSSLLE